MAPMSEVQREIIATTARRFGRARAAMTLWSMGINQSHVGTDKNAAILNLNDPGNAGFGIYSLVEARYRRIQ